MNVAHVADQPEAWEKVSQKLRLRTMPPVGRPRPDDAFTDAIAEWLERELDQASDAQPNVATTDTFHRLNRAEYQNAIRDLLAVDIDVASLLPADDADHRHGFDNIADVLSVSPALLERYLSAARKIADIAVGNAAVRPVIETYNVPTLLFQDDRASEDLPFGSRGGVAARHYFPVDGEYTIKIRLQRNYVDCIRGMGQRHELDVRLDGVLIKRFSIGGEATGTMAPVSHCGDIPGDPEWESYAHEADAKLEARFTATAGTKLVGVSFVRNLREPDGVLQGRQSGFALSINEWWDGDAAVDSVAIGGPYRSNGIGDTPSRRRIFTCQPTIASKEVSCAKNILAALARRAYRRPVTEADLHPLLDLYEEGRTGAAFDAGIKLALVRILVSPDFLFRIERNPRDVPANTIYRLTDLELASRLSFFLWSSIPDDELLTAAERGRLKDASVLRRQVLRMLADDRSRTLVDNFAGQWLLLRNIQGLSPDPDIFPDFDENLRDAFRRETQLFVGSQIREDRSVLELLTADYSYVNERLARHYGLSGVYGSNFRRVSLATTHRGGILAHGSLLAVTSYPNRTSPVLRGKWVLESLFGAPPPPPPPDVPSLPDRGEDGKPASVRARLEQHRRNPMCATCHANMDPLGFALEQFDAVGTWRAVGEGGSAIDTSATFAGSSPFQGLDGLRLFLMSRRERFVETVTEKLLVYALGRGIEYYDRPTVRRIVRETSAQNFTWSSIITEIVQSRPFQMRRTAP